MSVLLRERTVELVDVVKEFLASAFAFAARDEMGRQFFPFFRERVEETLHIGLQFVNLGFVGLCEDDAKGHTVLAKEAYELEVDALRRYARVNEHEEAGELLTVEDIVGNEILEFFHFLFSSFGVAITWKIHKVPIAIDYEVVDKHGLSGSGRGHGKGAAPSEHVDETALAYVASAYEGVLRQAAIGTLVGAAIAYEEFC